MKVSDVATIAAVAAGSASASIMGFNYGNVDTNGAPISQEQFEKMFDNAKNLKGVKGWNSARLYTMIQAGTKDTPMAAIPAALAKDTTMQFTLWASAGDAQFENELAALRNTISTYGDKLDGKVTGICIGSEDLYRDSVMGVQANAGIGVGPDVLINYVKKTKDILKDSPLKDVPIGHVDTWTAWVNGSNAALIDELDFLGFDAYPYFQNTMDNDISDAKGLLYDALDKTKSAAKGKNVIITETGWPVSGKTENKGVPSVENAKTYWEEVGCDLLSKGYDLYWYTLQDALPGTPNPSFGVLDSEGKQLYELSCSNTNNNKKNKVDSSSAAGNSTSAASTASGSGSASASAAVTTSAGVSNGTSAGGASSAVATGTSAAGSGSSGSGSGAATSAAGSSNSSATSNSAENAEFNGASALKVPGAVAVIGAVALLL